MYLQVSQTPSNTPSNTPSYTPSGTACPTPDPTVTPTATPTQSPYSYCPEEITLTWLNNQEAFSAATGTYNRVRTYTGGTFDYGWIDNNLPIDLNIGTSPDGNNYAVYERWDGATAYTLTNYYFLPTSTTRYYTVFKTEGSLINNQVITNYGSVVLGITGNTISGVYLPSQGQQTTFGQDMYIAYPAICPTPSITLSVTPTLTQTTTQTPSPTFCYEPHAYLVLDAQSGLTALNTWMASQGSAFRGL